MVSKKKKKKKRSSPKLSLIFRPNSEIQTIFQPKNRWSPKNKNKKRSLPKLSLIFRPKSHIQTLFHTESRHLLLDFGTQFPLGGCFQFFTKNRPKKQQKRAILHTSQANGGLEPPPPPPGYATAHRQGSGGFTISTWAKLMIPEKLAISTQFKLHFGRL